MYLSPSSLSVVALGDLRFNEKALIVHNHENPRDLNGNGKWTLARTRNQILSLDTITNADSCDMSGLLSRGRESSALQVRARSELSIFAGRDSM